MIPAVFRAPQMRLFVGTYGQEDIMGTTKGPWFRQAVKCMYGGG